MSTAGVDRVSGTQRDSLVAIADPDLADAVSEVFDRVRSLANAGEIDLVVLAARRLSCIYQALVRAGMPKIECEVVSDRVLELSEAIPPITDGPSPFGQHRRIALIDDCVIRGRTLSKLVERLATSEHHDLVSVFVICLDSEQADRVALKTIPNLHVMSERDTDRTRSFSLELTRVLFENLTPYFADFPVLAPHTVDSTGYLRLLDTPGWAAVETTPHLLKRPGYAAHTLVPSADAQKRVRARLGPSLASCIALMKVRVFTSFGADRPDEFVAVPLGLLKPLAGGDVVRLLTAVSDELHTRSVTGTDWSEWGTEAQQRLLQMFVSLVILQEWWNDLSEDGTFDPFHAELIDPLAVNLHFGEKRSKAVWNAIREALRFSTPIELSGWTPMPAEPPESPLQRHVGVSVCLDAAEQYFHDRPEPVPPTSGSICRFGESDVRPIAGIFGYVGRLERAEYFHHRDLRWLDEGLPLQRLAQVIPGEYSSLWTSLAIDVLNDLGVAVPATHTDPKTGCVYRRYRIGENVFLADALHGTRVTPLARRQILSKVRSKRNWLVSYFFTESRKIGRISAPIVVGDREGDLNRLVDALVKQVSAPTK